MRKYKYAKSYYVGCVQCNKPLHIYLCVCKYNVCVKISNIIY